MRFANYGRKSVYSDKSDSVDNQFRMCKEYVDFRFPNESNQITTYSDEDYTGANTDRPGLKAMIQDIKDGMFDALIVYQLDRLSRDVRDFSNLYALLEENHVLFLSIKESIDTNTPIGKAMMYVTVVFAQMERETIAQRVSDNMLGLAKKGYWTGGNPPYGYVRERIEVNGKKHVTIVPDPEGVKYVKWIFDTFLVNDYSLQGMETAFRQQGIKTLSGKFFSTTQLHKILTMPYCVPTTPEVYDFYEAKGCKMAQPREAWCGQSGVIIYGRTTEKNKKHSAQPPEEWTVCIGYHEPFMDPQKWLRVQERFSNNKFDKTMKYDVPLLKGVLRCKCGGLMQVARKKLVASVSSHYYCIKRQRQGTEVCDMRMLKTEVLDNEVLDIFRQIEADPAVIRSYVAHSAPQNEPVDTSSIQREIARYEARIGRLTATLADAEGGSAAKYILEEIERQDKNVQALKRELELARMEERKNQEKKKTAEQTAAEIGKMIRGLDNLSASDRNAVIKEVVKECVWDGETLYLKL